MPDNGKTDTALRKLWQTFDEIDKAIVFCLCHITNNPVSLETLVSLSGASIMKTLNLMEKLRRKNVVCEKRAHGKGMYFLNGIDQLAGLIEDETSDEKTRNAIKRVIDFYTSSSEDSDEKTLILAGLYRKLADRMDGLDHIKKSAEILYRSGDREKAIAYYDYLLECFTERDPAPRNRDDFVDIVLKQIFLKMYQMPTAEKLSLLGRAAMIAERYEMWDHLARVKLAISNTLLFAGQWRLASRIINDFWSFPNQVSEVAERGMFKTAGLSLCYLLFTNGRYSEAANIYEKIMGNREEFGDDEGTLKAGIFVGFFFALCGNVARGMGIIDAAREKANSCKLPDVVNQADMLAGHVMLEIRNVSEAEFYANRILNSDESALNHLMLWAAYTLKAYVLCFKRDYSASYECHKKGWESARAMGWIEHPGAWTFEYLALLESKGFVDEFVNYDSEIKKNLKSRSIYIKGYTLRYRALQNMEKQRNLDKVMVDLKNSEKLLKRSGAEIELARTRVALGDYFVKKGNLKAARPYIEKAFKLFSRVDKNLFPKELLEFVPKEYRIEVAIERIITVVKSLGRLPGEPSDVPFLLEQVISIAMDLTMATQGSFFVLEPYGEPRVITNRNFDFSILSAGRFESAREVIVSTARKDAELVLLGPNKDDPPFSKFLREAGINSVICMPAKLDGITHGYLYLANPMNGVPFSESHVPFVRLLCTQIALGLFSITCSRRATELKDRLEAEASSYKYLLGNSAPVEMIIGQSEGISRVIDQIRQVAPTDSTVLVKGETGVGKELVAKAIHNLSDRKDQAFITVNLAALPPDLVASELFGHEKGAFTSANEMRKGRFELVDKGTIFLDEIGDLPLTVQTKLLRVLQEGAFERLGSVKPIRSDFRVIAATNRDLYAEITRGAFRQDLYYRLNVFPIVVPPLRERRDDIPALVHHFVNVFSSKMRKRIGRIPKEELKKLLDYHWPGNVRELQHLIERSVILSNGNTIRFLLYDRLSGDGVAAKELRSMSLADVERDHIERVLHDTGWKIKGPNGAASILKLDPSTLRSRMKKLDIKKPSRTINENEILPSNI